MELILENIEKAYGKKQALKGINYCFKPGIYGLLGANGAGKTTLMNLITDNLKRERGYILFDGIDILKLGRNFRGKIGYMPQQQGIYRDFSPKTFLYYIADLKGIKRKAAKYEIDYLLEKFNLTKYADDPLGSFSGGMKQRVLLAQAIIGNPDVILLDEPTAGLDPKERITVRNYIAELSNNKIIILATHIVSDIETIADQVIIMKEGDIKISGTPTELIYSIKHFVGEIICSKESLLKMQEKYKIGTVIQKNDALVYRVVSSELPEEAEIVTSGVNLEDVYLYYFT